MFYSNTAETSGSRFNIKMTSYQYKKSHCGDKTILRPSYLHNGISYTGKTTSLYWIGALLCSHMAMEWKVVWFAKTDFLTHWGRDKMAAISQTDIFQQIFLNENVWIAIKISLEFVSRGPTNNSPSLVQMMACRWLGYKPLSEQMMVSLLMHICLTWPQWDNWITANWYD